MPEMNGVEFLEQAMDIVPRARRALLTAYADTDAAIRAINVVDVDHYLLKPWEPAGGEALPGRRRPDRDLAQRSATGPSRRPKVLGHRWSAESFAARDFLARNAVPYRWYNVDEPDGARLLDTAGADGGRRAGAGHAGRHRCSSADRGRDRRGRRPHHHPDDATSTTSS